MNPQLRLFLLVLCMAVGSFFSSVSAQKLPIRFGIKGEVAIPNPVSNLAFKKSFSGVYEAGLAPVINISSGLMLGAFGHFGQYKIPINKIANINTKRNYMSAGVRAGYEFLLSETIIFSVMLDYGFSRVGYKDVECIDSSGIKDIDLKLIRPSAALCFVIDPDFALGIHMSYSFLNEHFDPTYICLENSKQYFPEDFSGKTNSLNFGVSLYYFLTKKGMEFKLKQRNTSQEEE